MPLELSPIRFWVRENHTDEMGKDKAGAQAQQYKMDKYTTSAGARKDEQKMPEEASGADKFAEILEAIQASRSALEGQIGGIQTEVSLVRQDLRNVVDRVTETEGRVSELEETVKELKTSVSQLEAKAGALEYRAEDAENRARRSNLRFIGFPEGAEGALTEQFLEDWVRQWVPADRLSTCFVLERAHRSMARRPPTGAPPRPIIAKILNYKDRDAILRQARELGSIAYENSKILIFPDYTLQVQKARRNFETVKSKLRTMGLQYRLMFPAKLKVLHNGKSHFFSTPGAAWEWATETPTLVCNDPPPWGTSSTKEIPDRKSVVRERV